MLRVEGVYVRYDHVEALKGVSLEVLKGEVVALIGANGAGKTTTLMAISGLVRPYKGRILLDGRDISSMPAPKRVGMGISHVPEGRQVFPYMTVLENLEMGAYIRKDPRGIAEDLNMVEQLFPILKQRRNQSAGTLSGGEQQMLAIARALMARPRVLLLDEPSLGLSPVLVEEIFGIVKRLKSQGSTILLVEQNSQLALSIADRGYVLETGRVVLEGKALDLVQNEHVRKAYLGEV